MRARGSPYEMYETVSTTTRGRILLRMAAASAPATAPASKRDRTHYLYLSVIAAVVLGIVVGLVAPAFGKAVQAARHGVHRPDQDDDLADHLLHDRAGHRLDPEGRAGRQGRRDRAGLLRRDVDGRAGDRPAGRQHHPAGRGPARRAGSAHYQVPAAKGTGDFLLGIIPTTLFSPLTGDNVLSTLFVALLVGFALQAMGRTGEPVLRASATCEKLVFRVLAMIMWAAPIGAFGAIAAVVGGAGWAALGALASVMLGFYITCALFVLVVLGTVLRAGHRHQHPAAAALPRPGVPADRVDVVVGVGAAAADREDGARRASRARSSASPCPPATRSTSTAPRST